MKHYLDNPLDHANTLTLSLSLEYLSIFRLSKYSRKVIAFHPETHANRRKHPPKTQRMTLVSPRSLIPLDKLQHTHPHLMPMHPSRTILSTLAETGIPYTRTRASARVFMKWAL
jgi:hypothetical protein